MKCVVAFVRINFWRPNVFNLLFNSRISQNSFANEVRCGEHQIWIGELIYHVKHKPFAGHLFWPPHFQFHLFDSFNSSSNRESKNSSWNMKKEQLNCLMMNCETKVPNKEKKREHYFRKGNVSHWSWIQPLAFGLLIMRARKALERPEHHANTHNALKLKPKPKWKSIDWK